MYNLWNYNRNLILTGSYDKVARIWDMSGNCISNLLGHTAPIKTVSWIEKSKIYYYYYYNYYYYN